MRYVNAAPVGIQGEAASDRAAEVKRVLKLGATFWRSEQNYTTLRDIEGNQFCIIDAD